jgi:hypothetical protein
MAPAIVSHGDAEVGGAGTHAFGENQSTVPHQPIDASTYFWIRIWLGLLI